MSYTREVTTTTEDETRAAAAQITDVLTSAGSTVQVSALESEGTAHEDPAEHRHRITLTVYGPGETPPALAAEATAAAEPDASASAEPEASPDAASTSSADAEPSASPEPADASAPDATPEGA